MKKLQLIALIVSTLLVLLAVPYTILEWLNKSITFSNNLLVISGMALLLFGYNLWNYRKGLKR
jgi:hypothetical protein